MALYNCASTVAFVVLQLTKLFCPVVLDFLYRLCEFNEPILDKHANTSGVYSILQFVQVVSVQNVKMKSLRVTLQSDFQVTFRKCFPELKLN